MFFQNTIINMYLGGCTPCECGAGACTSQIISSFGATLVLVLVPALISKITLSFLLQKNYPAAINFVSTLLGIFYISPLILRNFLPNISFDLRTLFALVSIVLTFFVFSLFNFLKKLTSLKSIFVEGMLITVFLFLTINSFQFLTKNFTKQNSTFPKSDSEEQRVDSITPTVKPITRDEQIKQNTLQSLGIQQKADAVVSFLKLRDYAGMETLLNPTEKFSLEFRDYGGVHFSSEEFNNVLQQQKLSEVPVYKRVDDYTIMADTFLNTVSDLLQGQYTTDVYLNDHNYIEEGTELSAYNQVDLLYTSDSKTARLTFQKDNGSNWFLQEIGYFDPDFPGY